MAQRRSNKMKTQETKPKNHKTEINLISIIFRAIKRKLINLKKTDLRLFFFLPEKEQVLQAVRSLNRIKLKRFRLNFLHYALHKDMCANLEACKLCQQKISTTFLASLAGQMRCWEIWREKSLSPTHTRTHKLHTGCS